MGDYTIQEIHSQPAVWRCTLERMRATAGELTWLDSYRFQGLVLFTGCGSSYYLALAAAAAWTRITASPASALSATDLMIHPECHVVPKMHGTAVAISRSGKTPETHAAVTNLKKLGWPAIAVSCRRGGHVLSACDAQLVLEEAAENSRFTTRALTAMLLAVLLWAARRGRDSGLERELSKLPDLAEGLIEAFEARVRDVAQTGKFEQHIFLGHGPYFGLASEAMLKTKEMAGTPAEAYYSQELMHGPKYAVGPSTFISVLLSDSGRDLQLELLPRIKALGAQVLVICEEATPPVRENSQWCWELKSGLSEYGRMLLMMPLLQLFAYHRALTLGKVVD